MIRRGSTRSRRKPFGAGRRDGRENGGVGQQHGVGMGAPRLVERRLGRSRRFPAGGEGFRSEWAGPILAIHQTVRAAEDSQRHSVLTRRVHALPRSHERLQEHLVDPGVLA
jgi:hypothetical protein